MQSSSTSSSEGGDDHNSAPKLTFNIKTTDVHKKRNTLSSTATPVSTPASVRITSFTTETKRPDEQRKPESARERDVVIPALPNTFLPHKRQRKEENGSASPPEVTLLEKSEDAKAEREEKEERNGPMAKRQKTQSPFGIIVNAEDVKNDDDGEEGDDDDDREDNGPNISIEAFGRAMLRGMGWRDGEGIGRKKLLVQPVEAKARPKSAGIGSNLSKIRQIQQDQRKAGRIPKSATTPTGALHSSDSSLSPKYRTLEEKLLDQKPRGLQRDAIVAIVGGPHEGLIARILRVISQAEKLMVRLNLNKLETKVRMEDVEVLDLSKLGESHEARKFARLEEVESGAMNEDDNLFIDEYKYGRHKSQHGGTRRSSSSSSGTEATNGKGTMRRTESKSSVSYDTSSQPTEPWLIPHIRVRVISKTLNGGKYYQRKGVVIDVPDIDYCTLRMDDSRRLVDRIPQDVLETVIPKTMNCQVICVSGKYRGKRAIMVNKSRSKERCDLHLLDDEDGHHLVRAHFDDVCEYVQMNT